MFLFWLHIWYFVLLLRARFCWFGIKQCLCQLNRFILVTHTPSNFQDACELKADQSQACYWWWQMLPSVREIAKSQKLVFLKKRTVCAEQTRFQSIWQACQFGEAMSHVSQLRSHCEAAFDSQKAHTHTHTHFAFLVSQPSRKRSKLKKTFLAWAK